MHGAALKTSKRKRKYLFIDTQVLNINFRYHITYSSNLFAALHEALAEICEEGLENRLKRHKECAKLLWPGIEKLGGRLCVEKPENRFSAVTAFALPKDVDRLVLIGHLLDKYLIFLFF